MLVYGFVFFSVCVYHFCTHTHTLCTCVCAHVGLPPPSVANPSLPAPFPDDTCHHISFVLLDTGSGFNMLTFPYGRNNGWCVCVHEYTRACVCVGVYFGEEEEEEVASYRPLCVLSPKSMPNLCTDKRMPVTQRHTELCVCQGPCHPCWGWWGLGVVIGGGVVVVEGGHHLLWCRAQSQVLREGVCVRAFEKRGEGVEGRRAGRGVTHEVNAYGGSGEVSMGIGAEM